MREIIIVLTLSILTSCGDHQKQSREPDNDLSPRSVNDQNNEISSSDTVKTAISQEILLSEKSLDTFSLPFPERNMLPDLQDYYTTYQVVTKIGKQDGPDFPYVDIMNSDANTVAFLSFDYENTYKLDEIRVLDTTVVDMYKVRVGDTYQELIEKRTDVLNNSTDYHAHTYLYSETSNIYYELACDLTSFQNGPDTMESITLSKEQLQKCTVQSIIWRQRKQ